MISMIRGQFVYTKDDYLVIDVNGVGYKVYAPVSSGMLVGQTVTLHTYLQVREDAMVLFGFPHLEQLELFELLISVSGMGPKGALGVLTHLATGRVRQAVLTEDIATLTKIPGVGKKTAQRLVLELKDKFKPGSEDEAVLLVGVNNSVADQALDALISLGYSASEAKKAMAQASKNSDASMGVEDLIKLALKQLM
jgi:holliday junction DNA helicase RuvA